MRQITYLCKLMNNSITNSDITSLNPLNVPLLDLLHAHWLDTVLVRTRWFGKTICFPQWFGVLHYGNQINKRLVSWCSPLTFSCYVSNVTQIYFWNYFIMRIKYDGSINKKIVKRTISIVGFDLIKNQSSYLYSKKISILICSIRYNIFFGFEDKIWWQ